MFSFYTLRSSIRNSMLLSQSEIHNRNKARLREQIIEIVKNKISNDPNLTFRSIELQLDFLIKSPGFNYFANSSLTADLERDEGISKGLKDIFKGNKAALEEFFESLNLNEEIKPLCDAVLTNAKSGFMNLIQAQLENKVDLSLLTKTLERVFLRVKIDLNRTDITEYDSSSEYDISLLSQILNNHIFLKSVIVQNPKKDSSFRDFLFSLLKSNSSCMTNPEANLKNLTDENLVQVLGILQKFGNEPEFEVTKLMSWLGRKAHLLFYEENGLNEIGIMLSAIINADSIDRALKYNEISLKVIIRILVGPKTPLDPVELKSLLDRFSLNVFFLLSDDLIPRLLNTEHLELSDLYSKLCSFKEIPEKAKLEYRSSTWNSQFTKEEIVPIFIDAIVSQKQICYWNTFSVEQQEDILRGKGRSWNSNIMFFSVLFDEKNKVFRQKFLNALTDDQLKIFYNSTSSCFESELFSCLSAKQKLVILKDQLNTYAFDMLSYKPFDNVDWLDIFKSVPDDERCEFLCFATTSNGLKAGFPKELALDIFKSMTFDKQFDFILKAYYQITIKISELPADWQLQFFDYLTRDSFEDDCAKFVALDSFSQKQIFLEICSSSVLSCEQLLNLFDRLTIEDRATCFSFLPLDAQIQIWNTFSPNVLDPMFAFDTYDNKLTNSIASLWNPISFDRDLAKFEALDGLSQEKIFRSLCCNHNLSCEKRLVLFGRMTDPTQRIVFNSIGRDWSPDQLKCHLFEMWCAMDPESRKRIFVRTIQSHLIKQEFWKRLSHESKPLLMRIRVDLWIALSPAERVSFIPQDMWVMEAG